MLTSYCLTNVTCFFYVYYRHLRVKLGHFVVSCKWKMSHPQWSLAFVVGSCKTCRAVKYPEVVCILRQQYTFFNLSFVLSHPDLLISTVYEDSVQGNECGLTQFLRTRHFETVCQQVYYCFAQSLCLKIAQTYVVQHMSLEANPNMPLININVSLHHTTSRLMWVCW